METPFDKIKHNPTTTMKLVRNGEPVSLENDKNPDSNRITFTGEAVLQRMSEEEDFVMPMSSFIDLNTSDEPYKRSLQVSTEWAALDYGWVENPRIIVMRHHSKKKYEEPPMIYLRQEGATEPLLLPLGESLKLYITPKNVIEISASAITNMLLLVVPE